MTALFETMLALHGRIVQLDEHIDRMARSCRALGGVLNEGAFRDVAGGAVAGGEHAIRVVYENGTLAATAFPVPEITRSRRLRGRAMTLHASIRRELPRHKRYPQDVRLRELIDADFDEALFMTGDGAVLEGTSTNVFATRGDVLITAPDGVLPGVVRAWVLAQGFRVEERAPSIDELSSGGFFTGSLTTLAPIRTLNGQQCAAPGAVFTELVRHYGVPWNPP